MNAGRTGRLAQSFRGGLLREVTLQALILWSNMGGGSVRLRAWYQHDTRPTETDPGQSSAKK